MHLYDDYDYRNISRRSDILGIVYIVKEPRQKNKSKEMLFFFKSVYHVSYSKILPPRLSESYNIDKKEGLLYYLRVKVSAF